MAEITNIVGFQCKRTGLYVLFLCQDNSTWVVVAFGDYISAFKQIARLAVKFEFGYFSMNGEKVDGADWLRHAKQELLQALPVSEIGCLTQEFYMADSKIRYLTSSNLVQPSKTRSNPLRGTVFNFQNEQHRSFAVQCSSNSPFSFGTIPHSTHIREALDLARKRVDSATA